MRRRRLLGALAAGIIGAAGCTGDGDGGGDSGGSEHPTTASRATAQPTVQGSTIGAGDDQDGVTSTTRDGGAALPPPPTVAERRAEPALIGGDGPVTGVDVQPAIVSRSFADTLAVFGDAGEQYVIADLTHDTDARVHPDLVALDCTAGTFEATTALGGVEDTLWNRGPPLDSDADGWVAVEVPKPLDAGDARLVWPDGSQPLTQAARTRLGRDATSFAVDRFALPDAVGPDERFELSVAVENTGGVDGTFVGALTRSGPGDTGGPVQAVILDVPAGETVRWSRVFAVDGSGDATLALQWPDGATSDTVSLG